MPFIINLPMKDIKAGINQKMAETAILIQILDPDHPDFILQNEFKAVYQFRFLDVEQGGINENQGIQPGQVEAIVKILQDALQNNDNVIVHCHAGLCRSGAIAEVGVMMGFHDTGRIRKPNCTVKQALMKYLGWTYH